MKPFTINKNSWHYKLANNFGGGVRSFNDDHHPERNTDFCSYFWKVFFGAFWFTIICILGAFLTGCVADFGAWVGAMIVTGHLIQPGSGALVVVAFLVLVLIGCIVAGADKLKEVRRNAQYEAEKLGLIDESEPGFIKMTYRKFKDKTCVQLNFVG